MYYAMEMLVHNLASLRTWQELTVNQFPAGHTTTLQIWHASGNLNTKFQDSPYATSSGLNDVVKFKIKN
jgi:hypothetical protein